MVTMCVVQKVNFPENFLTEFGQPTITSLTANGIFDIDSLPHNDLDWNEQLGSFLCFGTINKLRKATGNTVNRILIFKFDIHFNFCEERMRRLSKGGLEESTVANEPGRL
jgi:hypothetical protein